MEDWNDGRRGTRKNTQDKEWRMVLRPGIPIFYYSNVPRLAWLMRLLSLTISIFILCLVGCQKVQKPELKGEGPLAITVDRGESVPESHAPLERWRTLHVEALNRGDFSQKECVLCHNPQTGCNQCHRYVGAKEISVAEASLYWPEPKGEKR